MARQENSPRIGSSQARLGRTTCGIAVGVIRRPGRPRDGAAFGHPGPNLVQLRRRCDRSRRSHLEDHRANFGRGSVAAARRGTKIPQCAARPDAVRRNLVGDDRCLAQHGPSAPRRKERAKLAGRRRRQLPMPRPANRLPGEIDLTRCGQIIAVRELTNNAGSASRRVAGPS